MKHVYNYRSLMLLLSVCLFVFSSNAQNGSHSIPDWNFTCADGKYVEVYGSGTQLPAAPPAPLAILNTNNIDSIIVEVIYKGPQAGIPDSVTIAANAGQSYTISNPLVLPNFGSTQQAVAFRKKLDGCVSCSNLLATVWPSTSFGDTWSFIAYVYRSGSNKSSTGVYNKAVVLNNEYTITLPTPITSGPKDITVNSLLSEVDDDTTRIVLVNITAGAVTIADTVKKCNVGTSLNLKNYFLTGVAGSVDSIVIKYTSQPVFTGGLTGDSFIPAVNITVESCPCDISLAVDSTNILCNGDSTGSITITPSGGTVPYTYAWSPSGGSDSIASNLTAGTYTVTVTDASQCTATRSITITQPLALGILTQASNVTCGGQSDGSASAQGMKGTSPYTYLWSNTLTTDIINGLSGGFYTVTVTDDNSCTLSKSVFIFEGDTLECTATKTDVLCNGDSTGTATANPSGGILPYTYQWSDGQSTQTAINLAAGTYTVIVRDQNGISTACTDTCSVTVNDAMALSCSTMVLNGIACYGDTDGRITVSAMGGTGVGTYSYAWSNGLTDQMIMNLAVGVYTATVTDGNQCTSTCTAEITQPDSLYCRVDSLEHITCNGANDGKISISGVGGSANLYSISISGSVTAINIDSVSSYTFSNLEPGTFLVIVRDYYNMSCTSSCNITIEEPDTLTCTITKLSDVSCIGGNDGSASIQGFGGTAPYSYNWGSADPNALAPGTYIATVTDANLCTSTCSVTIGGATPISCTVIAVDEDCFGDADGFATVNVTGGLAPYSYMWSNNDTTQNINNLARGIYTVTVTDSLGCVTTCQDTVGGPDSLYCLVTVNNHVSCNGGSDASITTVSFGGPGNPEYFDLKDSLGNYLDGNQSGVFNGLAAGTYTVIVTDRGAASCQTSCSVTITEPSPLTCDTLTTPETCNGLSDGTATVIPGGGTPPYGYLWSTIPAQTNAMATGLVTGNYTVTVTDSLGCDTMCTVFVGKFDSLVCTVTKTDITCYGADDGTATAHPSGGTGSFTYQWGTNPVQTTQTATGLKPGSYSVVVSDASPGSSCFAVCTVTITEPDTLTCSIQKSDISCFGDDDGFAVVNPVGGTPPFTYLWSNNDSTKTINGLEPGIYTVTVTDSSGCTAMCQDTIFEPDSLFCTISIIDSIDCNGLNGIVTVTLSNGCTQFETNWIDNSTGNPISASGNNVGIYPYDTLSLPAGTYTVTLTDRCSPASCTASCMVTITEPDTLTCSTTQTNVTCAGGNDGQATVTANGGTSPYTYLWSDPSSQTTATASNLTAGNYSVTVTDTLGCDTICSVTITDPDSLICTIDSSTNVSCNGGNDGSATVSASGGTGGYTYQWSDPAAQTTATATGLSAGTYTVVVKDQNGVSSACSDTCMVSITEPDTLTCTVIAIDVSCFGDSNGVAAVNVGGGTAPFTYLWSNNDTTNNITGLTVGIYTVTVTDSLGCITICQDTVKGPDSLYCQVTITNHVSCYGGSDGAISAVSFGGTLSSDYWYLEDTLGNNIDNNGSGMFTGLAAGTYVVTVEDRSPASCLASCRVTITEPDSLVCTITDTTHVTCTAVSDGSATADASGGTAPYSYQWANGDTTATATNLSIGTYTVIVTDSLGCMDTCEVNIGALPLIMCSVDTFTNVTCAGAMDGTATVTVTGGSGNYAYQWNVIPIQTTKTATGLGPGSYTVIVSDVSPVSSCFTSCIVTITEPDSLVCSIQKNDIDCFGDDDGIMSVNASGGTSPYSYLWSTNDSTATITGLDNGIYTVTVTDSMGCTVMCQDTIFEPDSVYCTITVLNNVSCAGGNDGSIYATLSNGVKDIRISIFPFTLGVNSPNDSTITNLPAGTYTVNVTDNISSCTVSCMVTITEPDTLTCTTTQTNVTCAGGNDGQATVTPSGGTAPYTYLWNTSPNQTTATASSLTVGTYTVTVTDTLGCDTTCTVIITEPDSLICTIDTSTNVSCNGGNDGTATVSASGGTGGYTYQWSDPAAQTTATATGLSAGTYTVIVKDQNGNSSACSDTCSVTINQPDSLIASCSNEGNVTCNGGNDGSASVSATGGTTFSGGIYHYDWSNGQTTVAISNLTAGTYSVIVTDSLGCMDTCEVEIMEPPLLVATCGVNNNVSCNGVADGSATVNVSGGTPPYVYTWRDSTGLAIGFDSIISNLAAGTYTVEVRDQNAISGACADTCTVTITEPDLLTCTIAKTDVLCKGDSTGSATVNVNGGTTPYTYAWTPYGGNAATANNLIAGNYTVTVTDSLGCDTTCSITITEPDSAIFITKVDTFCFVNFDMSSFSHGSIIDTVVAGDVTVTVTANSNGGLPNAVVAFDSDSPNAIDPDLVVNEGNLLILPIDTFDNNNDGLVDSPNDSPFGGIITLNFSSPISIKSFTFVDQDVNDSSIAIAYNSANVAIDTVYIPNGGDSSVQVFTMDADNASRLVFDIAASGGIANLVLDCPSGIGPSGNGSIDVTVAGGTPGYTYLWSNSATTQDIDSVPAGIYTVTVTDNNGCTETCSTTLSSPNQPRAGCFVSRSITCFGGNDGELTATVIGGTAPYSYLWSNGATTSITTNCAAGAFIVTVFDANGNVATESMVLGQPAAINSTVSSNDPLSFCPGGSALLEAVYDSTCTYQWYIGTKQIAGAISANYLANKTGNYSVEITNSKGCVVQSSKVNITKLSKPQAVISALGSTTVCPGISFTLSAITGNGYTYQWKRKGQVVSTAGSTYNSFMPGKYKVIVTDANGCEKTSNIIEINKHPRPLVSINPTGLISICAGSKAVLSASPNGGPGPYTYQWYKYKNQVLGATNQVQSFSNKGGYSVRMYDSNGCLAKSSRTVVDVVNCTPRYAKQSFEVKAFPNPFRDELNIDMHGDPSLPVNVIIHNVLGEVVYQKDYANINSVNSINLDKLISGMYLMKVTQGDEMQLVKVNKIN